MKYPKRIFVFLLLLCVCLCCGCDPLDPYWEYGSLAPLLKKEAPETDGAVEVRLPEQLCVPAELPEKTMLCKVIYTYYAQGYVLIFSGDTPFTLTATRKEFNRMEDPVRDTVLELNGLRVTACEDAQGNILYTWKQNGVCYTADHLSEEELRFLLAGMRPAEEVQDIDALLRARVDYPDVQSVQNALGAPVVFPDLSALGYVQQDYFTIRDAVGGCRYEGAHPFTYYVATGDAGWFPAAGHRMRSWYFNDVPVYINYDGEAQRVARLCSRDGMYASICFDAPFDVPYRSEGKDFLDALTQSFDASGHPLTEASPDRAPALFEQYAD